MAVVSGKKRAVLVGVSYKGTTSELTGPANDVNSMSRLLVDKFGFPRESILELTEDLGAVDTSRAPTRENMLLAMRWLVEGCKDGDSLVFHFSGHGKQSRDENDDEVDWFDEALCPVDYVEKGNILDDEIKATIVQPLIHGVKLHAIIDTCHSGTMLDLRYLCRLNRRGLCSRSRTFRWDDQRTRTKEESATDPKGGHAISISGCRDYQKSVEPNNTAGGGVMTWSFVEVVRSEKSKTYGELLESMRVTVCQRLQQSDSGRCLLPGRLGSLAAMCLPSCFLSVQEPQLCSSEKFNVYDETFLL